MVRNTPLSGFFKRAILFSACYLTLSVPLLRASEPNGDPLRYFKNYFVTGDYAVAGVGLRGTGVNGFATGTINMTAVPCGATSAAVIPAVGPCDGNHTVPGDAVAAFLYWETEEKTPTPSAVNGFFNTNPIVGKVLGSPDNRACWSSGGTSTGRGRVYRADVLRELAIDHTNNVRLGNGMHQVKLPDSGGNGNGNILYTSGATLVVVYRIIVPGQPRIAPLRAVVS